MAAWFSRMADRFVGVTGTSARVAGTMPRAASHHERERVTAIKLDRQTERSSGSVADTDIGLERQVPENRLAHRIKVELNE
jgi:hypothetical protein